MTAPTLYTPNPERIDADRLAADVLGFAGIEHPSRELAARLFELISDALAIVQPGEDAMKETASDLRHHFRSWARTLRETRADSKRGAFASRPPIALGTHGIVSLQALDRLRYLAACAGKPGIKQLPEIRALREAADNLTAEPLEPVRIALASEGGIVQGGGLQAQLPVELAVIDYDEKGAGAQLVLQRNGQRVRARVYQPALGQPEVDLDVLFAGDGDASSSIAET